MYFVDVVRLVEIFKNRKVILYGCGKAGRYLAEIFKNSGIEIVCGIVTNIKDIPEDFYSVKVFGIDEYFKNITNNTSIVVSIIDQTVAKSIREVLNQRCWKDGMGTGDVALGIEDLSCQSVSLLAKK